MLNGFDIHLDAPELTFGEWNTYSKQMVIFCNRQNYFKEHMPQILKMIVNIDKMYIDINTYMFNPRQNASKLKKKHAEIKEALDFLGEYAIMRVLEF